MQLTDSIRQVKIVLVVAAVVIAMASLLVLNVLTSDLKEQEQHKMEIWAEAMRSLNTADENTDLNLVLKIINTNDFIPVIVMDDDGAPAGHSCFQPYGMDGGASRDLSRRRAATGNGQGCEALADGELTEKKKQILFKNAEVQGIDLDEFEMVLYARLFERNKEL